jgi:hypothetical protein
LIKIYREPNISSVADLTDANALVSGHNRRRFLPEIRKLYLRNDNVLTWASNLVLQATSTGLDIVNGTNGFGFKFSYGDLEPTDRVWQNTGYNAPILLNNIGTAMAPDTSFKPFWMRIEVSPYVDVSIYEARLLVSYVEHSI